MEKPLLTLKPDLVNALIPLLLKYLVHGFIFGLMTIVVFWFFRFVNIPYFSDMQLLYIGMIAVVLFLLVRMGIRVIMLANTTYYFFKNHVVSEFKLFKVTHHSVPYERVSEIKVDISLWDRFCNAGDIILHTAEDMHPDMKLFYIKNPEKIEEGIYKLLPKNK